MSNIFNPGGAGGGLSALGVSAGTTNIAASGLSFVNSNGVTFGLNGSTLTASVGTAGGGLTAINVSAGTTSNNLSNLVLANLNGISFGLNGSTLTASHNGLTTARASNDAVGLNTAQTNVTWTVNSSGLSLNAGGYAGTGFTSTTTAGTAIVGTQGTNGLSIGIPAFLTTAMASNAVTLSNVLISAGTTSNLLSAFTLANSNGISFGLNAGTVTASHNGLTSQSNQALSGSNGSFTFQTATFGNLNGVSFYTSNGSLVASHNGLTTARASTDAVGLNTAQTNVTWTVNSSGISLNAAGYAGTGTTFAGTNVSASATLNSNGLNLALSAAAGAAGGTLSVYATSNTTQSSSGTIAASSLIFAGAGIASVGVSNGSVVVSVPAGGGAGDGGVFAGVSTIGNTGGSTGTVSTGNFVLVGSNNITLSQSTGAAGSAATVSILGPNSSSLVGGAGISLSTSGSTISIIGNPFTLSYWNPQDAYVQVAGQQGQGTLHFQPMQAPNVVYDRLCIPLIFSNATNSSGSQTLSIWAGIYTRTGSTLSLASSTSYSTAITASGTVGAYSSYGGLRLLTIGSTNTITEGQYWFGIVSRTTSGGANATISQVLCSQMNSTFSGVFGETSNQSHQYTRGLGRYSASTTGIPNSVAFSEIYGNSSLVLRQPMFYFVSGTI